MALPRLSWNTTTLHRYRPALYVLVAVAAGLAIYQVYESPPTSQEHRPQTFGLHRSNAQRRRRSQVATRRDHDSAENVLPSIDFLSSDADDNHVHGSLRVQLVNGDVRHFELSRRLVSTWQSDTAVAAGFGEDERVQVNKQLQASFLILYLYHHLEHRQVSDSQRGEIISSLVQNGFATDRIQQVLALNRQCRLRSAVDAWISNQAVDGRGLHEIVSDASLQSSWREDHPSWEEALTIPNTTNDSSSEDGSNHGEEDQGGRSLLNLLFSFADEQHRRSGFTHRGITCDSCGAHPIRGIRYRCSNCRDYDLCESCEAQGVHLPTHLFYKVRIPKAHLGHEKQPVKYTGKIFSHAHILTKRIVDRLVKRTGFGEGEIHGLWEQFRCQASADWPQDPFGYGKAVNRTDFQQLLIPVDPSRPPAPNLIYDRIFSFYDSDNNELIGFNEMLDGLSILYKKGPEQKLKGVIKGFDLDGDGFVNRRDFLRMFKAHYAITKAMTDEIIITSEEDIDDYPAEELISGGQPLSSNFSLQVPTGRRSRSGEGKDYDEFGDAVISDGRGTIDESEENSSPEVIAVQRAEQKVFGSLKLQADRQTHIDITDIVEEIRNDAWPPTWIEKKDALTWDVLTELEDINQVGDQQRIRQAAHGRWAWDWQNRQFVRWQALRGWRRRQTLDQVEPSLISSLERFPPDEPYPTLDSLVEDLDRIKYMSIHPPAHEIFTFLHDLSELIKPLTWPLEPEKFRASLVILLDLGFSHSDIVESIKGYALEPQEVDDFAAQVLQLAGRLSSQYQDQQRTKILRSFGDHEHTPLHRPRILSPTLQPKENASHFDETLPESVEDYGQETVYQITAEALNEMIDPILKVREDLWLEAQATRAERKLYRTLICNAIGEPSKLMRKIHAFLEQCRIKEDYPPTSDQWTGVFPVTATFFEFLERVNVDLKDDLTSEECSSCEDARIEIGETCRKCSTPSSARQLHLTKRAPTYEKCSVCASRSRDNSIEQRLGGKCATCYYMSSVSILEDEWLWTVLSGSEERAQVELDRHKAKCLDRLAKLDCDQNQEPLSQEKTSSADESVPHDDSAASPSLSTGNDTAPPSVDPSTPRQDTHDSAGPVVARNTASEEQYPAAAVELHELVSDFDAGNPEAFESAAAQKTISELIDEAGYSVAANDDTSPSQQAGPPRSASPHQQSPLLKQDSYRDPTLPQNRPDKLSEIAEPESGAKFKGTTPHEKAPDVNTLRYWAALTIIEAEDEQKRGGPGRISGEEFLDLMQGERGANLAFLGDWMKLTAF